MKRSMVVLWIGICLISVEVFGYSGGSGEPYDPYQIATAQDLMGLGDEPNDYDKAFILTADINLDPNLPGRRIFDQAVIAPVSISCDREGCSYDAISFSGYFNGQGHVIRNLKIRGQGAIGLFGRLERKAMVTNLGMEAVDIYGTGDYVGGLAGKNEGVITLSYCSGSVSANQYVGGLVGWNANGIISSSYSRSVVNGEDDYVGGLAGYNSGCITSSHSSGLVSGGNGFVGGLVGKNVGSISSCYSTGSVSGEGGHIGGLVGKHSEGSIVSSFWDIQTSGLTQSAGGTGLATAAMQDINTYVDAGWDWMGETTHGTSNVWKVQAGTYPCLAAFSDVTLVGPQGIGTLDDPFEITDANELGSIGYRPLAHYRLAADMDLSGITWAVAVVPWFGGTFDGNGYEIRNLKIEGGGYLGLFGQLGSKAMVSNLTLQAADIEGTGESIGSLVGKNYGTITSSFSRGSIRGKDFAGGLVGNNYGSITSSDSSGLVSGDRAVGGLVGLSSGGITSSWSSSSVNGERFYAGGLVGYNAQGSITFSYSSGSVSGDHYVGGLVGWNCSGSIASSYSIGSVRGHYWGGGLVGENDGSIASSYSSSPVSGTYVGGLVGFNNYHGSITSSYSSGPVSGVGFVGGLVGTNYANNSITLSFWDTEASGLIKSAGGTGLITAQMQDINTYVDAGWDRVDETTHGTSNVWIVQDGNYPSLAFFNGIVPVEPRGRGTLDDPYEITDANELGSIGYRPLAHYRLAADIDLSGITWSEAVVPWFGGEFNGDGHEINNLHIKGGGHLGLFGQLGPEVMISNLGLQAVDIYGTADFVGGLAGCNSGIITASHSNGTVSCEWNHVGGLMGYNSGIITFSHSNGSVSGRSYVGGLTGWNSDSIISSHSNCSVSGAAFVGGLVGWNHYGSIVLSYSSGLVSGSRNVGDLVGYDAAHGDIGIAR